MYFKIYLILIIIITPLILKSANDFTEVELNIKLDNKENIKIKSVAGDEMIKGTLYGTVNNLSEKNFENYEVECDFLGRSYKGRGFSCGFANIEDLNGFCYINGLKNNDTLIASWKCTTTAGFGNDASCQGKLNIIQGYGEFSGVVGFGKISMPLAKSFSEKNISNLMTLNLNIKYPLSLKKNVN